MGHFSSVVIGRGPSVSKPTEDQLERYIAAMEHQFIKNGPIQYH